MSHHVITKCKRDRKFKRSEIIKGQCERTYSNKLVTSYKEFEEDNQNNIRKI